MKKHLEDELINELLELDQEITIMRAWAKEPESNHGGLVSGNTPLFVSIGKFCSLWLEWSNRGKKVKNDQRVAAKNIVALTEKAQSFCDSGASVSAANVAANAVAEFYSTELLSLKGDLEERQRKVAKANATKQEKKNARDQAKEDFQRRFKEKYPTKPSRRGVKDKFIGKMLPSLRENGIEKSEDQIKKDWLSEGSLSKID